MTQTQLEFQQVYEDFHSRINNYLTHLVGRSEAADLTQEVFIKINQALGEFKGEAKLSTWIYRIATNAAVDKKRKLSQIHRVSKVHSSSDMLNGSAMVIPSVEQQLIHKEMNECIRSLIDKLPEKYRTVLILSEMEGFKNMEIAEILGLSLDTVKIRLHRAREKLKNEMLTFCNFYRDERNELACDRKNLLNE